MSHKIKISIVYFITLLFVATNVFFLVKENTFVWFSLPLVLIAGLLFIYSTKTVFYLAVFSTPFAVLLATESSSLSLPSEPLLIGILIFSLLKFILDGYPEKKILRHPVSIAILLNLFWVLITSFTSEIPLVSIKSFVARIWFIVPMFFVGILLYKNYASLKTTIWLYAIALAIVCLLTTYLHSQYGFSEKTGHWIMSPYYNDHTAYGAILALFLPLTIYFSFDTTTSKWSRYAAQAITVVLLIALFLSYCRAAWLSLIIAFIVYFIIWFKIRFRWIFLSVGVLALLFFTFQFEIIYRLEKNKQDSSQNFVEHIQSITNISSDASNLERINRWQSAIRMSKERPFFGWGAGTYQFIYAPYQSSTEKTIISTNSGDLGNVHNEYLAALTDSGFLGLLTFLAIVITALYTGINVYKKAAERKIRLLALSIVIGLVSYFIHGFLNNFLDTDKLSVPVWCFIGILVALDLFHSGKQETLPQKNSSENQS